MSRGYFAVKLTNKDILSGHMPDKYDRRECALCEDSIAAYQYLAQRDESSPYPSIYDKTMPKVGMMLQGVSREVDVKGMSVTSSMLMDKFMLTGRSFIFEADAIHNGLHMAGSIAVPTDVARMQECAFHRAAVVAEYQRYQAEGIPGIQSWYRAIASVDPENLHEPIAGEIHVNAYRSAVQDELESANKNAPQFIVIDKAMIAAADRLAQSDNPHVADIFTEVAKVARDVLREDALAFLAQCNPELYPTRALEKVTNEYKPAVALEYAAQMEKASQHQQWTPEMQAVYAMREALKVVYNKVKMERLDDALQLQPTGKPTVFDEKMLSVAQKHTGGDWHCMKEVMEMADELQLGDEPIERDDD